MTQITTNMIGALDLQADYLSTLPPGSIVLEMLTGPSSTPPAPLGVGMIVSLGDGEGLLPFTLWSSLNLQPGELYGLHSEVGVKIPECTLSAEVDLTAPAPNKIATPTGLRPPALTVKAGQPLILAVRSPAQPSQRQWIAYDLSGATVPHFTNGSDKTFVFNEWILVLTLGDKRTEIRIK